MPPINRNSALYIILCILGILLIVWLLFVIFDDDDKEFDRDAKPYPTRHFFEVPNATEANR